MSHIVPNAGCRGWVGIESECKLDQMQGVHEKLQPEQSVGLVVAAFEADMRVEGEIEEVHLGAPIVRAKNWAMAGPVWADLLLKTPWPSPSILR